MVTVSCQHDHQTWSTSAFDTMTTWFWHIYIYIYKWGGGWSGNCELVYLYVRLIFVFTLCLYCICVRKKIDNNDKIKWNSSRDIFHWIQRRLKFSIGWSTKTQSINNKFVYCSLFYLFYYLLIYFSPIPIHQSIYFYSLHTYVHRNKYIYICVCVCVCVVCVCVCK